MHILLGHRRLFLAIAIALITFALLPHAWSLHNRSIATWDIGAASYLLLALSLFAGATPDRMAANAEAQEDGEWTLFWIVVAGTTASLVVILDEFRTIKNATPTLRDLKVGIVVVTLGLSWLLTHITFALRYAHEYYSRTDTAPAADVDRGLDFPSEKHPDYWDFVYFSIVLGMTFQVSDVQITSRKFRRLATIHGMLGFLFNTVILALTVNLASGLLS